MTESPTQEETLITLKKCCSYKIEFRFIPNIFRQQIVYELKISYVNFFKEKKISVKYSPHEVKIIKPNK